MTRTSKNRALERRRGAIAVLVAICLPMFLALICLFIGITQIHVSRAELRVATDAAARTAAESILRTEDEELAYQAALSVTQDHSVSSQSLTLQRTDVVFGQGRSMGGAEWEFIPDAQPYNAAQVQVVRNSESAAGPIRLFLSLLGTDNFEASKSATASQVDHDIVFVIEAGGSMHAPQRWQGVLEAFEQLRVAIPPLANRIRAAIVVCHDDAIIERNLSQVNAEFEQTFREIHEQVKDLQLIQGRDLGGGLLAASKLLELQKDLDVVADQTIVFLGNGDNNRGTNPVTVGRTIAERGQVLYSLTFGHNADKEGHLEQASLLTGGKYFNVQDLSILEVILKDIVINPSIVLIR